MTLGDDDNEIKRARRERKKALMIIGDVPPIKTAGDTLGKTEPAVIKTETKFNIVKSSTAVKKESKSGVGVADGGIEPIVVKKEGIARKESKPGGVKESDAAIAKREFVAAALGRERTRKLTLAQDQALLSLM